MNALKNNISGDANTATGENSLQANSTGFQNTATGMNSLNSNDGNYNTGNGSHSLYNNSYGFQNCAFGYWSLYNNQTGSNNTACGALAGPSTSDLSNTGAFGYNAQPTASNRYHVGNTSVTWIGGQVGWSTYSDARFKRNVRNNVHGLDFILALNPVTYQWDIDELDQVIGTRKSEISDDSFDKARKEQESITYTGFLAQDVEVAAKDCGFNFSGIQAPVNEHTPYSLRYAEFVVPLVEAVQEQQEMIKKQDETIEVLLQRIDKLEQLVKK
jgi:trimeric autotransporter adhesin